MVLETRKMDFLTRTTLEKHRDVILTNYDTTIWYCIHDVYCHSLLLFISLFQMDSGVMVRNGFTGGNKISIILAHINQELQLSIQMKNNERTIFNFENFFQDSNWKLTDICSLGLVLSTLEFSCEKKISFLPDTD